MQHLQPTVNFLQDGVPSLGYEYFGVSEYNCPQPMNRVSRPNAWSLNSPDVALLDLFWGGGGWGGSCFKDRVNSREVLDVKDLRASITAAVATVITKMLLMKWLEQDYRLYITEVPSA